MSGFFSSPLIIGSLQLPNRLVQGPLAGYSCAPFRRLFSLYRPPAYCVSEMVSAHDVVHRHSLEGRYLYRAPDEKILCYQIAGNDPSLMAEAAARLASSRADLIDINCGCPKAKIRKKGAGSALMEQPERLLAIVRAVRSAIACPLTVKLRLAEGNNTRLAKAIADAGADALIIHGRLWTENYDTPCDRHQLASIKQAVDIPVIANGDITNRQTLLETFTQTGCDAFMISRATTGKPWLFQELLSNQAVAIDISQRTNIFMKHLGELAELESEHQAVLQSKSLVRHYFRDELDPEHLQLFYRLTNLTEIDYFLNDILI